MGDSEIFNFNILLNLRKDLNLDARDLLFKCKNVGYGGGIDGHWMAFIRRKGSKKTMKIHYTGGPYGSNVDISEGDHRDEKEHPETPIRTRSYRDIFRFCAGYKSEHQYLSLADNCRTFCINLAEYCSIPVYEVNKSLYRTKTGSRIMPSSQIYSGVNAVKGTYNGVKEIRKGNVVKGGGGIGKSVVKNTAKIGVSTANQAIDTTAAVVKMPFKMFGGK